VEELKSLCTEYKAKLEAMLPDDPETRFIHARYNEKICMVNTLLATSTPKGTLYLLVDPRGPLYKAQLEEENYSDWKWRWLIAFLIIITFPISVPILIAYSWITRDELNFLKSDGAIFVDKLIRLSEAELQRTSVDEPINLTSSTTPLLRTHTMDNQANPHNPYGSTKLTSLIAKTRTPSLAPSSSTPARASKGLYASMFDLEADTLKGAGKSEILASRIRPFSYTSDEHLTLDFYCNFKYTNATPLVFSIQIPINLDPVVIQPLVEGLNTPEQEAFSEEENLGAMVTRRVQDLFFTPPPTFEDLMKNNQRWCYKDVFYKALELAKNDNQRVLAIEGIINGFDITRENCIEDYRRIERDTYYFKGSPYPVTDEAEIAALRIADYEQNKVRQTRVLAQIEEAHNKLPANYRTIMTPSVRCIARSFHAIFELLAMNQIGEAKFTYTQVKRSNFTPFVKLAFSNLHAMWHQLNAIFWLIDTHGYHMDPIYPHESIPKDHDLRQHVLSVYVENGSICCAAITPENTVDRFMLEDAALNRQADVIRGALGDPSSGDSFSEEQRQAVYCAVAHRGYYQLSYLSPFTAQDRFIKAHNLVKYYHPALAAHLKNMVLEPFQALMNAGEAAKQNTSIEIKRAFVAQQRNDLDRNRGTDLQWAPLPSLSDDEWAELLDLETTKKSQI